MEKVKLNEVTWFQEGPGVRNTQYTKSGVKLLNVANLVNGKVVLSNTSRFISEDEAFGKYKHFLCDDGDLIIASSGIKVEYLDKKMGFVTKDMLPLCMNTSTIRFKVKDKNQLDIKYLMYFFKSNIFKDQIQKLITGSAQLNYGPSHLNKVFIKMNTMNKQKEIVNKLDKITNMIENQEKMIKKYDDLVKSQFIEMFGDVNINDKNWNHELVGEAFNVSSGGTPSTTNEDYWKDGKISWIGSNLCQNNILYQNDGKFISQKGYDNSSAKLFAVDTVLVALVGATIGKTALLKFETTTNQNIAGIDVPNNPNYTPEYVYFALQQMYGKFLEIGNGKFKMANLSFVRNLDIPTPPIVLQNQFADFVKHIDKLKFTIKESIEKLNLCYQSLMKEYFE